ncbi:MAG: tyrosine-type recombinase/integrase [Thiobacillaceae bacterium]
MEPNHTGQPSNKRMSSPPKAALKPKDLWAIRIHLPKEHHVRDLALFDLAIDSTLRGCDLVNLRVRDVARANRSGPERWSCSAKAQRSVQFELTDPTRCAISGWIEKADLKPEHDLFPSRLAKSPHVLTRHYARIVYQWVAAIGLDSTVYATHTMRPTKATLIHKRTTNPRAVQLLPALTQLGSTVRFLGIEVDDTIEISEQTGIWH